MSVFAMEILDSAGVKYVWYRYSNQRIMILITESNAINMVTLSRNSRHLCSIMMTSSNWSISALLAFVRGIHRHRWIPLTKASDTALWCFFELRLE